MTRHADSRRLAARALPSQQLPHVEHENCQDLPGHHFFKQFCQGLCVENPVTKRFYCARTRTFCTNFDPAF